MQRPTTRAHFHGHRARRREFLPLNDQSIGIAVSLVTSCDCSVDCLAHWGKVYFHLRRRSVCCHALSINLSLSAHAVVASQELRHSMRGPALDKTRSVWNLSCHVTLTYTIGIAQWVSRLTARPQHIHKHRNKIHLSVIILIQKQPY